MIRRPLCFLTGRITLQQRRRIEACKQLTCRRITTGTIIEAELVSPLNNDLKEAIKRHDQLLSGSPSKKEVRSSLEIIRRFQYQTEKWREAMETEEMLHHEHYESSLEMAQSHNRFGILNQNLEDYSKSQSHFERSLRYYIEFHPPDTFHEDIGEACNHLADVAAAKMELELALQWLERSEPHFRRHGESMFNVKDKEDVVNKKKLPHPELRKCLENKGQIFRLMNRHKEALEVYREIEENVLVDNQEPDQTLKLDLADSLFSVEKFRESEKLYMSVLDNIDSESLTAATIRHKLGLIDASPSESNGESAMFHFQTALALRKRMLGETHVNVAKILMSMGVVRHVLMGDSASALADFREALIIYRANSEFENDEDDIEVKKVLKNISLVQRDLKSSNFVCDTNRAE